MMNTPRRLLFFVAAFMGGLGLLTALLLLFTRSVTPSPRASTPSPQPPTTAPRADTPAPQTVATVDGEPISLDEWRQAVALDRVMSALVGQSPPSPEGTLDRLINQRLVLRAAVAADSPQVDQAQAAAWLTSFLTTWNLDEAALDQALARAGLTHADLIEEIVPRLLRVEQALNELAPDGNAEAWVADLRDQAQVTVLEDLSVPPPPATPPSQPTLQPSPAAVSLPTGPRAGEAAPDFSLPATDGATVRLSDLRGRPVLLNFWATWCAPCRHELPLLQAAQQPQGEGLVVLGINVRESPDKVSAFASELDLELPLLLDRDGRVGDAYRVYGLPTSLLVDRDGLIAARHVGPLDAATLDGYLAPVLATPSSP